jgi:hypothetical protein
LKGGIIEFFINNLCVCHFKNPDTNKYDLAIKDYSTQSIVKRTGSFSKYASDGQYLFGRHTSKGISCLDFDLNTVWDYEFDRFVDFVHGNLLPYPYKDLVILNIGVDREKGGDGQIIALSKSDGSLVWKRHFEREPTFIVINDRVYVTDDGRMIVLEATTGKTLVDQPAGFETNHPGDSLWSNGQELFMVNMTLSLIRIFSTDGKTLLQELKIPEPFAPLNSEHFISHDGFYYLSLAIQDMCLNGAVYGLLILGPAEDQQKAGIVVEPRPYNQVLVKQMEDGQEYCHVILKDHSLEKVLKYGPILMKEYANVKGSQVWSDDRRNPKFNGRIVFSANFDDFSDEDNRKINRMIEETEKWFDTMGVHAGNRKTEIKIELGPSTKELGEAIHD